MLTAILVGPCIVIWRRFLYIWLSSHVVFTTPIYLPQLYTQNDHYSKPIRIGNQIERFFRTTAILVETLDDIFLIPFDLSNTYPILHSHNRSPHTRLGFRGPSHVPSLGQPPSWWDPSWDNSHLLEATHRVDTLWLWSYWIYTSLFSLRPRHGWSKVIMRWMDDAKRSAAALRRISWYLCQGYPSLFFEERPVSFVRDLLISFPFSPSCDLSSQGLLGRVLSA